MCHKQIPVGLELKQITQMFTQTVNMSTSNERQTDTSNDSDDNNNEHRIIAMTGIEGIKVYKTRWFQLFLFSFLSFSNAWVWISIAPIATLAEKYYNVSSFMINLLSTIYMFVFIGGNPICAFILERFGIRTSLLIGTALNMLGSWIRVAGSNNRSYFGLFLSGQILCAIAQCFILSIPPLLAAFWFPPNERSTATSIGAACNQLGIALGFLVTILVVNEHNYRENMAILACICASICTISGVLLLVFFREKPPLPPSLSQQKEKDRNHSELLVRKNTFLLVVLNIKNLMLDVQFMNLVIGFGVSQGCYYALSTLLAQLLAPYNYTTDVSGILGFILTISGIFGGMITGIVADKTQYHKALLKIDFFVSAGTIIGVTILLQKSMMFIPLCIIFAVFGFFITAVLPLSFELGAECTYDSNSNLDLEALSTGFLMVSAQVFGIIFTFTMDALIVQGYLRAAEWVLAGILCSGSLLIIIGFNGKLKRIEYEKGKLERLLESSR
jgi:FLVCR family feline leukemia virus subgroup C receptor-related protein